MGGYGSGRPQTRLGEGETRRLPVKWPAATLRDLRAQRAEGGPATRASGGVTWHVSGRRAGNIAYTVAEGPQGPICVLHYCVNGGPPIQDILDLAERPSNLPGNAGAVLFWRCPCGQLARVLYLGRTRFRCRRCVPVVYDSSRASDRRVSRLLRGIYDDLAPDAELLGIDLARLGAAQLAGAVRQSDRALLLALKALDKMGMGIGPGRDRGGRWHGSAGRPRPRRRP